MWVISHTRLPMGRVEDVEPRRGGAVVAATPAGDELSALKAEVDLLVDEATVLEAVLRDEQERLGRFRVAYVARVAPLMARVEFLEVEVARARGEITDELIARAEEAARVAEETPSVLPERPTVDLGWKERMKARYRRLARRVHPDLGDSDADRERRTALMARASEAWENGDEVEIAILEAEAFDLDDGPVSAGDRIASLVRSRDALRVRLVSLGDELRELRGSALESLRRQAEEARDQGRDLLADLVAELIERIAVLEAELAEAA